VLPGIVGNGHQPCGEYCSLLRGSRVHLPEDVSGLGNAWKRAFWMVVELSDGGVYQVIEVCD